MGHIMNVGIFLVLLNVWTVATSTVIVDSPAGKMQGESVSGDNSHVVFRNIPYAKPPVGELRFAKPEPHPKTDGVYDGTSRGSVRCLQPNNTVDGVDQGSEDCLILNIYAKSVDTQKLKKVMIFIHGGVYFLGFSDIYGMGSFVSSHDVIGVTINYRLGILGFLSTGNEASPGNYGLWDQAMAIKWVKDNIKAFGGDPDDITISGESAGGASVTFQTLTPVNKGVFSKVCPHSGIATSSFAMTRDVQKHALMMGKQANCWHGEITDEINLEQSQRLIKCLKTVDTSVFTTFYFYVPSETRFTPSVDGDFIPREPSVLLQDKSYLESIGFYDRLYLVSVVNAEYIIMTGFLGQGVSAEGDKTTDAIKKFYLQSRLNTGYHSHIDDKVMDFYKTRKVGVDAMLDMMSDLAFLIPSYDFLNAASNSQKVKSWFFFFNHYPRFMRGQYRGIAHAADLLFWLDIDMDSFEKALCAGIRGGLDEDDLRLKQLYSSVLAEFMKTGDPGTALKEQIPSGWPVYDPSSSHYLNFNLQPTIRSHLEREKRDLWLKNIPKWTRKAHQHTEL